MEMKLDKIVIETLCELKCLNCVHQKLCFNLLGGTNLQMKAEDCKDFLEINKDVWIPPVKFGDIVYVIEDEQIHQAYVSIVEAYPVSYGVAWTVHYFYSDDTFGEPTVYSWSGTYGVKVFKTEENAKKYLKENKKEDK